jgi:hypothetical protein
LTLFFPVIVVVAILLFMKSLSTFEVSMRLKIVSLILLLLWLFLLLLILGLSDLSFIFRVIGEILRVFFLWKGIILLFLLYHLIITIVTPFLHNVCLWTVSGVFIHASSFTTTCCTSFHLNELIINMY